MKVVLTAAAQAEYDSLNRVVKVRVYAVLVRLVKWPAVSGVKALRGDRKGQYRVRTGDYRVLFTVDTVAEVVAVFHIGDRKDVYED